MSFTLSLSKGVLATALIAALCAPAFAEEKPPEEPKFGGPAVGEEAPKLTVRDTLGRELELETLWAEKPLVLVTGSWSCPVYRRQAPELQRLFERYGPRAKFAVLYTVEAHPSGSASPYTGEEWLTDENRREGILLQQPETFEERAELASRSRAALKLGMPFLVDGIENEAWEAYGNAPNACYVINSEGEVLARQDWLDPPALEKEILAALQEAPPKW